MIIYSVTVTIDASIEGDWLPWMREVHIPDVMATGYFVERSMQRLLDPKPDKGTATFNIQYLCKSMAELEAYQKNAAEALQKDHTERYKGRFAAFRTLLERL